MIILYRDLLYYIVFYILYYLYLGGFHASDSLSLNGSHPDMLFNLYFFSVICRINSFLLLQGKSNGSTHSPKTGDASCRKIDDGNLNSSANTEIYAYSETTFGGPTLGYVMTENWIYGCYGLNEDAGGHLGHTKNGHK